MTIVSCIDNTLYVRFFIPIFLIIVWKTWRDLRIVMTNFGIFSRVSAPFYNFCKMKSIFILEGCFMFLDLSFMKNDHFIFYDHRYFFRQIFTTPLSLFVRWFQKTFARQHRGITYFVRFLFSSRKKITEVRVSICCVINMFN